MSQPLYFAHPSQQKEINWTSPARQKKNETEKPTERKLVLLDLEAAVKYKEIQITLIN